MGKPYRECPYCGANLDPCEICDCREKEVQEKAPEKPAGQYLQTAVEAKVS